MVSVVTNPKIWKDAATSPDRARQQIQTWVGFPSAHLLTETGDFLETRDPFET
jgi:hypothetical protein